MIIRKINKNDYNDISQLIIDAFTPTDHGYGNEAELVSKIRALDSYDDDFEIVIEENNEIIAHGLLSEVRINNYQGPIKGVVLAPLSVRPIFQKKGIGSLLIQELETLARGKCTKYISILGNPTYYSRFGYVPASDYNVTAPFEVPDEFFMIKELSAGGLNNAGGTLIYNSAFD